MRLWSIHPKYLDSKGLVALWREGLLAQKVLQGETKGYRNHPQLIKFNNRPEPLRAIGQYLTEVWKEADRRGYGFDKGKIADQGAYAQIPVTSGQLRYEIDWLLQKLQIRDPERYQQLHLVGDIECHPCFKVVEGAVENWEKGNN